MKVSSHSSWFNHRISRWHQAAKKKNVGIWIHDWLWYIRNKTFEYLESALLSPQIYFFPLAPVLSLMGWLKASHRGCLSCQWKWMARRTIVYAPQRETHQKKVNRHFRKHAPLTPIRYLKACSIYQENVSWKCFLHSFILWMNARDCEETLHSSLYVISY